MQDALRMAGPQHIQQLVDNCGCLPLGERSLFVQDLRDRLPVAELAHDIKSMFVVIEFVYFEKEGAVQLFQQSDLLLEEFALFAPDFVFVDDEDGFAEGCALVDGFAKFVEFIGYECRVEDLVLFLHIALDIANEILLVELHLVFLLGDIGR